MSNPHLDASEEQLSPDDKKIEKALRPQLLDDFSGQPKIVENLKVFISAAKLRGEALDLSLIHI